MTLYAVGSRRRYPFCAMMRHALCLTDCLASQVKSFHEGMRLVNSISKVPRQMPPAAEAVVFLSQCLMAFRSESRVSHGDSLDLLILI